MDNIFSFETTNDAKFHIIKCLQQNDWLKSICVDENGEYAEVYKEREDVMQIAKFVKCGGFFSKEQAHEYLRSCIILFLDEISNWLLSDEKGLQIPVGYDEVVGYVAYRGETNNTKHLTLNLRKDKGNSTPFGFFVTTFMPTE